MKERFWSAGTGGVREREGIRLEVPELPGLVFMVARFTCDQHEDVWRCTEVHTGCCANMFLTCQTAKATMRAFRNRLRQVDPVKVYQGIMEVLATQPTCREVHKLWTALTAPPPAIPEAENKEE